jgi:hypothetical protein
MAKTTRQPGKKSRDATAHDRPVSGSNSLNIRPDEPALTRQSLRPFKGPVPEPVIESAPIKRHDSWSEPMLEALEPHEHDFQEFKGSGWLMRASREVQPDFLYYLSKQVSAFVNGSGGMLFIGINDDGVVDGGIPTDVKGGGTRAWLEDLVSSCVAPQVPRCNVFEIPPRSDQPSRIRPGHAVYAIELPSSANAPHQAKDHRYYLRIAGKSRPMGHVHVQDVLRRTFNPLVEVSRLGPYGEPELSLGDTRGPKAFIQFRAFIANRGRTLARHVGLEMALPRPFAAQEVRRRMHAQGETHYTQTPGLLSFFRYHPVPLFPTQEVYASTVWVCIHANNIAQIRAGATLEWTIYADDSQPVQSRAEFYEFQVVRRAIDWIEEQVEASKKGQCS